MRGASGGAAVSTLVGCEAATACNETKGRDLKRSWKHLLCGVAALLGVIDAHAVYTITVTPVGSDVVMTGTGQIDTTAMAVLSSVATCSSGNGRWPGGSTTLCLGSGSTGLIMSGAITGAGVPVMGTGGSTVGSARSGAPVYLVGTTLYLPTGYVSNTAITNSVTFAGKTLATLGATVGTYTMTLSSGDTIVVKVMNATPVPTLGVTGAAAFALLLVTAAGFGLKRRRR